MHRGSQSVKRFQCQKMSAVEFSFGQKVKARTESYECVVTGMIEYHRTIDPLHYIQLIEINLCS